MKDKKINVKKSTETKVPVEVLGLYRGDLIQDFYDKDYLKGKDDVLAKLNRKMARYWCYHFRAVAVYENNPNKENFKKPNPLKTERAPEGFKEFVEGLKGFTTWEKFADKWDIYGNNPFLIAHRLMSVWKEWDFVMERVAIPVDSTKEEMEARVAILAKEYASKEKKEV